MDQLQIDPADLERQRQMDLFGSAEDFRETIASRGDCRRARRIRVDPPLLTRIWTTSRWRYIDVLQPIRQKRQQLAKQDELVRASCAIANVGTVYHPLGSSLTVEGIPPRPGREVLECFMDDDDVDICLWRYDMSRHVVPRTIAREN